MNAEKVPFGKMLKNVHTTCVVQDDEALAGFVRTAGWQGCRSRDASNTQ